MWVVYERPTDYPNECIARRWEIVDGAEQPTDSVIIADSLDAIRRVLWEWDLCCLERMPKDDPKIVEVWL